LLSVDIFNDVFVRFGVFATADLLTMGAGGRAQIEACALSMAVICRQWRCMLVVTKNKMQQLQGFKAKKRASATALRRRRMEKVSRNTMIVIAACAGIH
jgi:hypothetical protein